MVCLNAASYATPHIARPSQPPEAAGISYSSPIDATLSKNRTRRRVSATARCDNEKAWEDVLEINFISNKPPKRKVNKYNREPLQPITLIIFIV